MSIQRRDRDRSNIKRRVRWLLMNREINGEKETSFHEQRESKRDSALDWALCLQCKSLSLTFPQALTHQACWKVLERSLLDAWALWGQWKLRSFCVRAGGNHFMCSCTEYPEILEEPREPSLKNKLDERSAKLSSCMQTTEKVHRFRHLTEFNEPLSEWWKRRN